MVKMESIRDRDSRENARLKILEEHPDWATHYDVSWLVGYVKQLKEKYEVEIPILE